MHTMDLRIALAGHRLMTHISNRNKQGAIDWMEDYDNRGNAVVRGPIRRPDQRQAIAEAADSNPMATHMMGAMPSTKRAIDNPHNRTNSFPAANAPR